MTPIAPTGLRVALIELRFLVALCDQQQPVEVVLRGVFLEVAGELVEAAHVFFGGGVARPASVLQVTIEDDIAHHRAAAILRHEGVEGFLQLGAVLANRPGNLPIRPQRDRRLRTDVGEDLLPEIRRIAVDHGGVDQSGIHHLENVLVLQILLRQHDVDRFLARCRQSRVQRGETFVIAARAAYVHAAAGELLDRGGRRHLRRGHQQFADVFRGGRGEVDQLHALRRHGEPAGGDVAGARGQRRQQLIAGNGNEDHANRARLVLVRGIEIFLELHAEVVGDAALLSLVDEIESLAVHHQHAHGAFFQQRRQVAAPGGKAGGRGDGLWRRCRASAATLPSAGWSGAVESQPGIVDASSATHREASPVLRMVVV